MYATLTFFVLAFLYMSLKMYEKKNTVNFGDCILLVLIVILGVLTQYYFILFAALVGLTFLVFKIKEKCFKDLIKYIISAIIGAGVALCIYPYIISNVLGGNRGFGSLSFSIDAIMAITYIIYKLCTYIQVLSKDMFLNQIWLFAICAVCVLGFKVYLRFFKNQKLSRKATIVAVPAVVFFIGISLVSPFNSDRYVMASLPLIAMLFAFSFIKILTALNIKKVNVIVPASVLLASIVAFITVKPYYTYGKTNLYEPQTENCIYVGTAILEWNKCIDKFMQYDGTMIVQTSQMSSTLGDELEDFAAKRGFVTNGKINEFVDAYMNNGSVDRQKNDSLSAVKTDEKLNELNGVTVYISRLADNDAVIDYITNNTKFKNYDLIQADYNFDEFYNWYDYFVETESYCNVYKFY